MIQRVRVILRSFLLLLLVGTVVNSCDVMEQASQLRALTRCEFRLDSVSGLELAGVNIQNAGSAQDLSLADYAKITAAFFSGSVPLEFNLNIGVRNPNKGMAAMNEMDWILYIDDARVTSGRLDRRVEIPANGGTTTFPIGMNIDLLDALSGDSRDAVMNFAFNLAGSSERPTQLMLEAKPTIYVGGRSVEYPGYIRVRTEFTSSVF